jgi:hypothetical protein
MPQRIVGTVRYNTDTATRVHRRDDGQTPPRRIEILCRGVNGNWFLWTRGSPWQPADASPDSGALAITPLTLAEAIQWADVNMGAVKFAETFGALITEA